MKFWRNAKNFLKKILMKLLIVIQIKKAPKILIMKPITVYVDNPIPLLFSVESKSNNSKEKKKKVKKLSLKIPRFQEKMLLN